MEIIVPNKKIIRPFRNFDDVVRGLDVEKDHGVDLFCTLTLTNKNGKVEGKKTFECHSFIGNFTRLMCGAFRGGYVQSTKDTGGGLHTGYGTNDESGQIYNWYMGTAGYLRGPVVGLDPTAVDVDDYCLGQLLCHGTLDPNLTPGGYDSGSITEVITRGIKDSGSSWTADQWNGYLAVLTSGARSGDYFYINDTQPASSYTLAFDASYGSQYTGDLQIGDDYQVLTYGQLSFGTVSYSQPITTEGNTTRYSITRDFTNGQSGSVVIKEFGLYVPFYDSDTNYQYSTMIVRDVDATGYTLLVGQKLTVSYTIVTVC